MEGPSDKGDSFFQVNIIFQAHPLQFYSETFLEQDMEIKSLKESEKEHLLNVLMKTHWDLEKTSRLLKISLNRLKYKIKEYDIRRPDPQGS